MPNMLQELVDLGVDNIITFDAHDPRVQNAIPNSGFDSFRPAYQFIKAILNNCDDLKLDSDHLMIISPDEGATDRAVYLASVLGVNMKHNARKPAIIVSELPMIAVSVLTMAFSIATSLSPYISCSSSKA